MSIEPEPRPDEFEPEEAEPEEEYAPVGDHPDDATAHAAEADLLEQEQEVGFDEDEDAPDLAEEDRA